MKKQKLVFGKYGTKVLEKENINTYNGSIIRMLLAKYKPKQDIKIFRTNEHLKDKEIH